MSVAAVLLVAAALAAAAPAPAARVVVGDLSVPTDLTRECWSRVIGELESVGVAVVRRRIAEDADGLAAMRQAAAEAGAVGAVVILGRAPRSVEIRIFDAPSARTVVQRLDAIEDAPELAPAALAVRAVEVLRGNLAAIPDDRPSVPVVPALRPVPRGPRSAVMVGAAVLQAVEDRGAGIAACVRVQHMFGAHVGLRLAAAGLGTSLGVVRGDSGAVVTQQLGSAGLVVGTERGGLRYQVSLAPGVYRVAARGATEAPGLDARVAARWVLIGEVAAGLSWPLSRHAALFVDAAALLNSRRVAVRLEGTEAARTHAVSGTLGAGAAVTF